MSRSTHARHRAILRQRKASLAHAEQNASIPLVDPPQAAAVANIDDAVDVSIDDGAVSDDRIGAWCR